MPRVSQQDIRTFVADYESHRGVAADGLVRSYLAAAEVLQFFLGKAWVFAHVFGQGDGSPFLRAKATAEQDGYRHQDRVIALADMLFNLQTIDGFDERIRKMRRADVESSVAELEGAKLLAQSGISVRFVEESGCAGSDYDLEAQLAGRAVACETKCKVESTELSAATVKNALNAARSQLPSDRPSLVFMKIPEMWVRTPEVASVVEPALAASLRSTGRISAVVLHWEEWHTLQGSGAARVTRFRVEHNTKARWSLAQLGPILSPGHNSGWRHLVQLVAS